MRRTRPLASSLLGAAAATAAVVVALDARAAPPWVDRPLTLPAGDFAFDFGLGVAHVPGGPRNDTSAGINAEMSVGITSRVELGVRTGIRFGDGFDRAIDPEAYGRLFDRQTFDEGADTVANPEVRVRGAIVRGPIAEVALEGRVVLPFADGTGAGILFGVPLAFHLGDRVRLDTGAFVPVVFPPRVDADFAISLPLDVWIQASSRFWLGPMTGFEFTNVTDGRTVVTNLSLGLGLGYMITHAIDFKAMFLFPELNQDSRVFGFGAGVQIRIE
jgi:hypothetical protein